MSGQQFQAVRCFQCGAFQVQAVKKCSRKFDCRTCGVKQSVLKVYAIGKGAAVRGVVATLNAARLRGEEEASHCGVNAERAEGGGGGPQRGPSTAEGRPQPATRKTDWAAFLEEEDKEEVSRCDAPGSPEEMDGAHFVTCMPERQPKRMRRGGRGVFGDSNRTVPTAGCTQDENQPPPNRNRGKWGGIRGNAHFNPRLRNPAMDSMTKATSVEGSEVRQIDETAVGSMKTRGDGCARQQTSFIGGWSSVRTERAPFQQSAAAPVCSSMCMAPDRNPATREEPPREVDLAVPHASLENRSGRVGSGSGGKWDEFLDFGHSEVPRSSFAEDECSSAVARATCSRWAACEPQLGDNDSVLTTCLD